MKIKITFKDSDGPFDCVRSAIETSIIENLVNELSGEEIESIIEKREEEVWESLEKWIRYKEYITIVFDTDKMTAEVLDER